MANLDQILADTPKPIVWVVLGLGLMHISTLVFSYLQFVLNALVLGGTNVSCESEAKAAFYRILC